MKRLSRLRSLFALAAVCAAAACGSTSTRLDTCYATCDALYRCGVTSEVQTTNCRNDCTDNQGKYADEDRQLAAKCANASDIRSKEIACYAAASACNGIALAQCLVKANECVNK